MNKQMVWLFFCLSLPFIAGLPSTAVAVELDGVLEPCVVVKLGSPTPGVIEQIMVERGEFVKKGQVLAQLESGVEKATKELARLRTELESAVSLRQAKLGFIGRDQARRESLFNEGAISFYDKDEMDTNRDVAKHELQEAIDQKKLAGQELKQAEEVVARRVIRSPIDGVVVEKLMEPGEYVETEPIMKIAKIDLLHVEMVVPVNLYRLFHEGMQVEVLPEEPVAESFMGKVKIVDRVFDAASGTFGVRVELPNEKKTIPSGLKCRVRFQGPD